MKSRDEMKGVKGVEGKRLHRLPRTGTEGAENKRPESRSGNWVTEVEDTTKNMKTKAPITAHGAIMLTSLNKI